MAAVSEAYVLKTRADGAAEDADLHTVHPMQFMDVTRLIEAAVQQAGLHAGVVTVQTRHTTTGILINEYEPLLLADFRAFVRAAPPRRVTTTRTTISCGER